MLLIVLCSITSACATGVYGAAVTDSAPAPASSTTATSVTVPSPGSSREFGGASNLVVNGSFEHGTAPWLPVLNSELELTKSPRRFGHIALLIRPKILAQPLGAKVLIVGHPKRNSRYRFDCWIDASRTLSGSILVIQLQAVTSNARNWTEIGVLRKPVASGWRRYSVAGRVTANNTVALRAVLFAKNSVVLNSWLALDGVIARRLPGSS